jgi:hypothetical protein
LFLQIGDASITDLEMEANMVKQFIARGLAVALLALGFILASSFAPVERAHAQSGTGGVASVDVDVSPLRARGLGEFADLIRDSVQRELRRHYPTAQSGARLVVSLESIMLVGDPIGDSDSFGFGGIEPTDSLTGTAYLIGRDGSVIETYPLTASSPARRAGPPHLPLERERAQILGQVFAQWVARRF